VPALHQGDSSPGQGNKKGFSKKSIIGMFRTVIQNVAEPSLLQSGLSQLGLGDTCSR